MSFGEHFPSTHLSSAATGPRRPEIDLDALRDAILISGDPVTHEGVKDLNQRITAHNQTRADKLIARGIERSIEPLLLTSVNGYQSLQFTARGDPAQRGQGYFNQGQGWNRNARDVEKIDGVVPLLAEQSQDRRFELVESLIFTPATNFVICGTKTDYEPIKGGYRPVIRPRPEVRPIVDPRTKEPLIDVTFKFETPVSFANTPLHYRDTDPRCSRFGWNLLLKQSIASQFLQAVQYNPRFIHTVTDDLAYNLATIEKPAKMNMDDWRHGARQGGHPIRPPFEQRLGYGIPLHVFDGFTEERTPIAAYHDQLAQQFPRLTIRSNNFDETYAYIAVSGR